MSLNKGDRDKGGQHASEWVDEKVRISIEAGLTLFAAPINAMTVGYAYRFATRPLECGLDLPISFSFLYSLWPSPCCD